MTKVKTIAKIEKNCNKASGSYIFLIQKKLCLHTAGMHRHRKE